MRAMILLIASTLPAMAGEDAKHAMEAVAVRLAIAHQCADAAAYRAALRAAPDRLTAAGLPPHDATEWLVQTSAAIQAHPPSPDINAGICKGVLAAISAKD